MNLIRHLPGCLLGLVLFSLPAAAIDFSVSNNGFSDYVVNGVNDPTLELVRGQTYTFNIAASGHPFWIKTAQVTGTGSAYNNGVTGNGTQVGSLTFSVPMDAPDTLFYICQFHFNMRGTIAISDPLAEPALLSQPRLTASGTFEFNVSGTPGAAYSVEVRINSSPEWTLIGSTNAPDSGNFTFSDTDAGFSSNRLYRVRAE